MRKHDKYNIWLGVGGHVELHEDPTEAALREVKEEVGLDVVLWDGNKKFTYDGGVHAHHELIPPVALNRHTISPTHQHIGMYYFARSNSDRVVPENPTDEWHWLAKDELGSLDLLPDVKFYAGLALDTLAK